MRYRALDVNGDYSFGHGQDDFLTDSPGCVGQAVYTRLKLMQGEWFLDKTVGMPYATQVFIEGGRFTADRAAQATILGTQGVTELAAYVSDIDPARNWTVGTIVNTQYGQVTVAAVF
jgi:hypothetical protein